MKVAAASVVPAVNATGSFQTTDGYVGGFNLQDFSNHLATGTLAVSVQDDNGDPLNADELARIGDAIDAVNAVFSSCGVTLTWAAAAAEANVHIHFAASTPFGGMSEGVLGFTTESLDIYIVTGWSFYTGAEATGVGQGQYDFETLATHELGHAIGLGEGSDPSSVMYQYLPTGIARREFSGNLTVIDGVADRFMQVASSDSASGQSRVSSDAAALQPGTNWGGSERGASLVASADSPAHDANYDALSAIMQEWNSTRSYAQRVYGLSDGTGDSGLDNSTFFNRANGNFTLIGDDVIGQTVFTDNEVDKLTGSPGADWFFANLVADNGGALDIATDKAGTELWTDTDF